MSKLKKILFISPYPVGIGPSQRFRFEQYLSFLSEKFDYSQHPFWDEKSWDILYSNASVFVKSYFLIRAFFKRKMLLFSITKYDMVFIQREMAPIGPPIFEWIIKFIFRKPIIYDFDDAIWFLNYSHKNKITRYFKAPWKVKYICKWSSAIIVGNSYLEQFAKKYNAQVFVIPTTIDTAYHLPKPTQKSNEKLILGWTGTLTTLKQIDLILPVLRQLEQKYLFDFLVIANEKPHFKLPNLIFKKWDKNSEIEDLQSIDIGLMPLFDNEWEKGKCGFKGLQYMALEIPTVMSPVGVNTEIIQDGKNGFLASSSDEWFQKLSLLIENAELRNQLGKAGRMTIEERYAVKANKEKYLAVFNRVIRQK